MDQYSNSHKSKTEAREKRENSVEKKEAVVNGKIRKKNKIEKILKNEDTSNITSFVMTDIVIPSFKKAVRGVVDILLDGDTGKSSRRSNSESVSYRKYYREDEPVRTRTIARDSRFSDYENILLDSRGEAEEVLTRLDEIMETFSVVSVADLYDVCGIDCRYTDNKYGWTNISSAEPVRVRDGYILKMPRAKLL